MSQRSNHFDEMAYLTRYGDVADAIRKKVFKSGLHHFNTHGAAEGRICPIDQPRRIENRLFWTEIVSQMDGWLIDYAALLTMYLFDVQASRNLLGSLIEVGLYRAKYFSLFIREASLSGDTAIGIDTFGLVPQKEVEAAILAAVPNTPYKLIKATSISLSSNDLREASGGESCRFMSIDGSHEAKDVLSDLTLADSLMGTGGIVSVDDFMNVTAVGANEGVHAFFQKSNDLAPFAFLANKLLLCRPPMHSTYKNDVEHYIETDIGNLQSANFVENRSKYRGSVEQTLWDHKLLTLW